MKTKDEAIKALVQAEKLEKEAKELEVQYGISDKRTKQRQSSPTWPGSLRLRESRL